MDDNDKQDIDERDPVGRDPNLSDAELEDQPIEESQPTDQKPKEEEDRQQQGGSHPSVRQVKKAIERGREGEGARETAGAGRELPRPGGQGARQATSTAGKAGASGTTGGAAAAEGAAAAGGTTAAGGVAGGVAAGGAAAAGGAVSGPVGWAALAALLIAKGAKFGYNKLTNALSGDQRRAAQKKPDFIHKHGKTIVLIVGCFFVVFFIFPILMFATLMITEQAAQANPAQSADQLTITLKGPVAAKVNDNITYDLNAATTASSSGLSLQYALPPNTVFYSATGNGTYLPSANAVIWNTTTTSLVASVTVKVQTTAKDSYLINHVGKGSIQSNCVVTQVGSPDPNIKLPADCALPVTSILTGIVSPPNLDRNSCKFVVGEKTLSYRDAKGRPVYITGIKGYYCKMPPSLDGAYVNVPRSAWKTWGPQIWGSEEMIGVLYTVAKNWSKTYCDDKGIPRNKCKAQLQIHDITSPYHISHKWGVSVDLTATTDGSDCVGSFAGSCSKRFNALATIKLGKIIVDTGYMHTILHNGDTRAVTIMDDSGIKRTSSVNKEIYLYAQSKYPTRFRQKYFATMRAPGVIHCGGDNCSKTGPGGHDDHMHLYIDRDQAGYKYNTDFDDVFDKSKLLICTSVGGIGCGK